MNEAIVRENIRRILIQIGDEDQCKSEKCGATIFWVRHKFGKLAPYNIDGSNHFSTCPDRERFRRTEHDDD